jgi:hypothetical protein
MKFFPLFLLYSPWPAITSHPHLSPTTMSSSMTSLAEQEHMIATNQRKIKREKKNKK